MEVEFCNVLMDIPAIHLCTKSTTISSYVLQYNELTKRFNFMLCLLIKKNSNYDKYWYTILHTIVFAYCISIHSCMGFLPFKILYGQKSYLPIVLIDSTLVIIKSFDLHAWLNGLLQHHNQLYIHAHDNINRIQCL